MLVPAPGKMRPSLTALCALLAMCTCASTIDLDPSIPCGGCPSRSAGESELASWLECLGVSAVGVTQAGFEYRDTLDMCAEESQQALGITRRQSLQLSRCSSCLPFDDAAPAAGPAENERGQPRRIAHCITGAVRTLTEERVYMSIKDNLIGALGGSADVFFFLENGDTSPRGGFAGPLPVDRIMAVTDYLGAVKVEFQEDDLVFLRCQKAGKIPGRTYNSPWTAQLLKWRRCFDMIQEHEYRQNMRYDWIVKSRPDMRYEYPVRQDWDASKVYVGGIHCPDCLIALPRTHLYDVATTDNAACSAPSRLPAWSKLMELAGKAAFDPDTKVPTPTVFDDHIDTSRGINGQVQLFAHLHSRNVTVEIWEVPGMDTVRTPEAEALIAEVGWYSTTDTVVGVDSEVLTTEAIARAKATR